MQAGYIWALWYAGVAVRASVAHVSLLTRLNVGAAGRRESATGNECVSRKDFAVMKYSQSQVHSHWFFNRPFFDNSIGELGEREICKQGSPTQK